MQTSQHVLISLEERHAKSILSGTKKVELRRRTMHVAPGSTVWLYVKKPIGAVVGYATIGTTYSAEPRTVWQKFGLVSGLSEREFMRYFDGTDAASAMTLSLPKRLKRPITLEELRIAAPGFQPPQFYCRIEADSALKSALVERSLSKTVAASYSD